MKKTYNIPEIRVTAFAEESVLTSSGYSDPTKTTQENVANYIEKNNLGEAKTVILTW